MLKPLDSSIEQNNRLIEAVCNGLLNRDREQLEAKAFVHLTRQFRNLKGGEK